jgi:hypothetical protein
MSLQMSMTVIITFSTACARALLDADQQSKLWLDESPRRIG